MAFHGFGQSATSVAQLTELDEACEARGWAYLAPTGLDDQLLSRPDPVPVGGEAELQLAGAAELSSAWLLAGVDEGLLALSGGAALTVLPLPALILPGLPLSAGTLSVSVAIPEDPALSGLVLFVQAALLDSGPGLAALSNRWELHVD